MFRDIEQWKYKVHTPKGDGTYNVACGNCGGYHFINKQS